MRNEDGMIVYHVLETQEGASMYAYLGKVEAAGPRQAIKAVLADPGATLQGNVYVAVSDRHFKHVTVNVETVTQLTFT